MQKTTSYFWAVTAGVLLCLPLFAQQNLSGKVIDNEDNRPLIGATVRVGIRATISDKNGQFVFKNIIKDSDLLEVSYVGYERFSISLANYKSDQQTFEIKLKRSTFAADEVIVSATRNTQQSAMAYSDVTKTELNKQNLGQDLPVLLNLSPSLVTTSDAGAGVGYTGLRIRGTDATRINVTINGIPLNDAESHGVYWVNMPDFASSVSSVQIQRGVGTSTNGAAAFGATVNINTNEFQKEAYAEINNSVGSFATFKHTIKAGTGLLNDRFTIDTRFSKLSSDGFIDRAKSDLKSFYVSGAYFGKKSFVRFNVFSGKEKTYQAWEGVPEARLRSDAKGMKDFIERNYLNERDANNLLNANARTYNLYLYDNQTDNYQQDHYQVVSSHGLNNHWTLNANAFVVRGRGYYEQFKDEDKLSKYKLPNVVIGNQTIKKTDLIRRRWLDNIFYGTTFSLDYDSFDKLKANIGGGYNSYDGQHFGEVVWARYASNSNIGQHYYDNKGLKTDFNLYGKFYYQLTDALNLFADAQIRTIHYSVKGDDNQQRQQNHEANYAFFNPKLGFNYRLSDEGSFYASLSIANREPNRDDFTESTTQIRPQPETLRDLEWGYRLQRGRITASIGGYYMDYKNQLVLTGQVNDVGNPIKANVPKSYRAGIEIEATAALHKRWKWNGNATLSQNKIQNYTAYIINYDDENGGYKTKNYAKTDISFSPNVIVGSQMTFLPATNFEIAWLSKFVSRQFLDNTSDASRQLDAYFTNDLRVNCLLKIKGIKGINVGLLVNNVLSHQYESNGYTYSYIAGGQTTTENFYYPQAGRNFLISVGLRF